MDFENSTQAKSWIFDEDSLLDCKYESAVIQSLATDRSTRPSARKFACGFKHKSQSQKKATLKRSSSSSMASMMSAWDQETLVHFHAHQIQRLVGPNAIFPKLRRSSSALSTAIMLFRRFYLSNSVIDFPPRNIAAAACLLALKVDHCEERLEIGLLSHATSVVNMKAQNSRLCAKELKAVSIEEIEDAERSLLKGLDYQLRCHHPYGAIKVLAAEIIDYITSRSAQKARLAFRNSHYGYESPRSVLKSMYGGFSEKRLSTLCERALAISQSALVYSDVNFLFPPGQIAFAAVAIALEGAGYSGNYLGKTMRNYLRMRFPQKTDEELLDFENEVMKIIYMIEECPSIDLNRYSCTARRRSRLAIASQAAEVQRVFAVAAYFRGLFQQHKSPHHVERIHKRRRLDSEEMSSHPYYEAARVTPTHTPYF